MESLIVTFGQDFEPLSEIFCDFEISCYVHVPPNLHCSWVGNEDECANIPTTLRTTQYPLGASGKQLLTTTKYNAISNNRSGPKQQQLD